VDFVPRALELARTRAQAAGVTLELRQADVLDYTATRGFDLVLDSGCLHHLPLSKLPAYRNMLDRWLLPDGDYVLVHFGKRHRLDWRPVGPRRKSREAITQYLAPLRLEAYDETVFRLPLPAGPTGLAGVYWFRRPSEAAHP
jgi:cyclopropane fatty-acyl-phospholipid synthase-like methyltransferase